MMARSYLLGEYFKTKQLAGSMLQYLNERDFNLSHHIFSKEYDNVKILDFISLLVQIVYFYSSFQSEKDPRRLESLHQLTTKSVERLDNLIQKEPLIPPELKRVAELVIEEE